MTNEEVRANPLLKFYFHGTVSNYLEKEVSLSQPVGVENCSLIDNIDDDLHKYLVIIPVVYMLTFICILVYCIKYRKIKSQYELLKQDDETSINSSIELKKFNN